MLKKYIEKKKLKLNVAQHGAVENDKLLTAISKVYSHYNSLEGIVFYCRVNNDIFIILHNDGSYAIKDGYDGGNLNQHLI